LPVSLSVLFYITYLLNIPLSTGW